MRTNRMDQPHGRRSDGAVVGQTLSSDHAWPATLPSSGLLKRMSVSLERESFLVSLFFIDWSPSQVKQPPSKNHDGLSFDGWQAIYGSTAERFYGRGRGVCRRRRRLKSSGSGQRRAGAPGGAPANVICEWGDANASYGSIARLAVRRCRGRADAVIRPPRAGDFSELRAVQTDDRLSGKRQLLRFVLSHRLIPSQVNNHLRKTPMASR